MSPRLHPVFGLLAAALSASVLAVDLPHYATAAATALVLLLAAWLALVVHGIRRRRNRPGPR